MSNDATLRTAESATTTAAATGVSTEASAMISVVMQQLEPLINDVLDEKLKGLATKANLDAVALATTDNLAAFEQRFGDGLADLPQL